MTKGGGLQENREGTPTTDQGIMEAFLEEVSLDGLVGIIQGEGKEIR